MKQKSKLRIKYNIKRVQESASEKGYNEVYIPDIWSDNLRYFLYNYATQNSKTPLYKDINGYVDKDTEFLLGEATRKGDKWNV